MKPAARILLIEDSPTLRELVLQILEIENYETVTADDGESGLRFVRETQPDLVLCDIAMPGLDGHDVLRALRADPATAKLPFIFLTAKAERGDLRAGMELGADDYLTKPFGADELLGAIQSRLRRLEPRPVERSPTAALPGESLLLLPNPIRSPLAGMLGLAELLGAADCPAAERRSMAAEIAASGRRLERTFTNALLRMELQLARHEPERAAAFQGHAITPVNAAARAALAAVTTRYGATVTLAPDSAATHVAMAFAFLQKCLEELLDNALRCSSPHGTVRLKLSHDRDDAVVEILNNGATLTAEQVELLNADPARTAGPGPSSGLGLEIVHRLARFNRGSLTLSRTAEGGVSAVLRLPLHH